MMQPSIHLISIYKVYKLGKDGAEKNNHLNYKILIIIAVQMEISNQQTQITTNRSILMLKQIEP